MLKLTDDVVPHVICTEHPNAEPCICWSHHESDWRIMCLETHGRTNSGTVPLRSLRPEPEPTTTTDDPEMFPTHENSDGSWDFDYRAAQF